jgi:hypothetical protein
MLQRSPRPNPGRRIKVMNKHGLRIVGIYRRRRRIISRAFTGSTSIGVHDHTSKKWCGRRDLNPHGPFKPCGFSYRLRLSPPEHETLEGSCQVCGLDYPFTVLRKIRSLGAARLVSTPSRMECLSGLGSGLPFKVSPNLSSSASPVSQTSTQVSLSPLRMPFRHARARLLTAFLS